MKISAYTRENFLIAKFTRAGKKRPHRNIFQTPNETIAFNGSIAIIVEALKIECPDWLKGYKPSVTFKSSIVPTEFARKITKDCKDDFMAFHLKDGNGGQVKLLIYSEEKCNPVGYYSIEEKYPRHIKKFLFEKGKYNVEKVPAENFRILGTTFKQFLPDIEGEVKVKYPKDKTNPILYIWTNKNGQRIRVALLQQKKIKQLEFDIFKPKQISLPMPLEQKVEAN